MILRKQVDIRSTNVVSRNAVQFEKRYFSKLGRQYFKIKPVYVIWRNQTAYASDYTLQLCAQGFLW